MREIYILAGQSNASGRGSLSNPPSFSNAGSVYFYTADFLTPTITNPAVEPSDTPTNEQLSVGIDTTAEYSCALSFGHDMVSLHNTEIGVLNCAKGATSITQWQRCWDAWSLFGAMRWRADVASASGTIKGLIWIQGESDCASQAQVDAWSVGFANMVAALRADLGIPLLPVVFAQLGPMPSGSPYGYAQALRDKQSGIRMAKVAMITTSDLAVDSSGLHFTQSAQVTIGQRAAAAMNGMM